MARSGRNFTIINAYTASGASFSVPGSLGVFVHIFEGRLEPGRRKSRFPVFFHEFSASSFWVKPIWPAWSLTPAFTEDPKGFFGIRSCFGKSPPVWEFCDEGRIRWPHSDAGALGGPVFIGDINPTGQTAQSMPQYLHEGSGHLPGRKGEGKAKKRIRKDGSKPFHRFSLLSRNSGQHDGNR
jgi:hypothetical protein